MNHFMEAGHRRRNIHRFTEDFLAASVSTRLPRTCSGVSGEGQRCPTPTTALAPSREEALSYHQQRSRLRVSVAFTQLWLA